MRRASDGSLRHFIRFAVQILGAGALLAALGWLPTRHLGGDAALLAMGVAIGISTIASLVGAIPLALAEQSAEPRQAATAVLTAQAVRMLTALLLTVAAVVSKWFDPVPLLAWLLASYLVLMVIDTVHAARLRRRQMRGQQR